LNFIWIIFQVYGLKFGLRSITNGTSPAFRKIGKINSFCFLIVNVIANGTTIFNHKKPLFDKMYRYYYDSFRTYIIDIKIFSKKRIVIVYIDLKLLELLKIILIRILFNYIPK
jgi:hypothetical protein